MQFSSALLLAIITTTTTHAITYDRYGGSYVPTTQITDYAALDLDQYELNLQLANRKLMPAIHVYREGGFSGSYAVLTLRNIDPNQAVTIPAGAMVIGNTDVQSEVMGYIAKTKSWPTQTEEVELEVMYSVGDVQEDYLDCQVGGLWHFSEANRKGCFTDEGVITIVPEGQAMSAALEFEYFYDTRKDNRNKNTLQKLSTEAAENMILPVSNKYFPEFQAFVDYYGDADYGDKWVNAAHEKGVTTFSNDRGHADFTVFEERMGTGEAMKKGIAYLHIWMQVVNHLSKAVELCGQPGAIAELDRAVALYTGSLTTDPDEPSGILLYGLADVRSHQFKTAGVVGDMDTGTAHVNVEVMRGFEGLQGILNAQKSSLCGAGVEQTKQAIIDYMRIPLIQGVLRYTFIREFDMHEFNLDDSERTMAESATFAATIIPFVEKCDSSAARTLHKHTRVHATHTDFATVKRALESTYACLNVSCELVGGIWDRQAVDYRRGGEPCGHIRARSPVAGFFKFVAISATLLLAIFGLFKYRRVLTRAVLRGGKRQQPAPATFNGNIAAVAEIS